MLKRSAFNIDGSLWQNSLLHHYSKPKQTRQKKSLKQTFHTNIISQNKQKAKFKRLVPSVLYSAMAQIYKFTYPIYLYKIHSINDIIYVFLLTNSKTFGFNLVFQSASNCIYHKRKLENSCGKMHNLPEFFFILFW